MDDRAKLCISACEGVPDEYLKRIVYLTNCMKCMESLEDCLTDEGLFGIMGENGCRQRLKVINKIVGKVINELKTDSQE